MLKLKLVAFMFGQLWVCFTELVHAQMLSLFFGACNIYNDEITDTRNELKETWSKFFASVKTFQFVLFQKSDNLNMHKDSLMVIMGR